MVLTKYNKKSCDETMMVKGLRKSDPETTNRKIHQEDLEKIVAQMAKGLGLNEEIVKVMGKHHNIGHTFLGHSGEWWISNILDDYGIGCYCHNTLGARDLIFTKEIYEEIINKIRVHNPNINNKQLGKIKKSLWLIFDGINAHNGEKPEKEYIPDIHKKESDFIEEILSCYSIKGYDKKITPATPEASLMRLADQISYIPLDMLDGLREGMIRDEADNIVTKLDDDYIRILTQLGVSNELINKCNQKGIYIEIAERLKEIFIEDVIKNSTKKKITMSQETMKLMNELRNLNNTKTVNYVVLKEDQATYPAAIRNLMNRFKDIVLQNDFLTKLKNKDVNIEEALDTYKGTVDEGFIRYIVNINKFDYDFTTKIVERATKESISEELGIARKCVQTREEFEEEEEYGLEYDLKNARIKGYIEYYKYALQQGELIGYSDIQRNSEENRVYHNIQNNETNEAYINMDERMALSIAAQYISTLSDHEFIKLIQDAQIIDQEQYKSLTRKYKDITDLHQEAYLTKTWKQIKQAQKEATDDLNK